MSAGNPVRWMKWAERMVGGWALKGTNQGTKLSFNAGPKEKRRDQVTLVPPYSAGGGAYQRARAEASDARRHDAAHRVGVGRRLVAVGAGTVLTFPG